MKYRDWVVSVVLAVSFLLMSGVGMVPVYAQAGGAEVAAPTLAQFELNEAGVQAIVDKDYELAVQLFDSSLALGPLNITYVNRGRAYQHAGKCEQAEASYEAAFSAPAVSEPTAANVAATIERYRAELMEVCPGRVVLECDPQELHVSIDGKDLGACPLESIELSQGEHQIRGTLMGKSVETVVDVAPLKTRRLSLRLDMRESAPALQAGSDSGGLEGVRPLGVEDSVASVDSEPGLAGYLFLGGGAALLAGGAVMDNVPQSSKNGAYDHVDVVPVGLYVGAAVLVVYGIITLMN